MKHLKLKGKTYSQVTQKGGWDQRTNLKTIEINFFTMNTEYLQGNRVILNTNQQQPNKSTGQGNHESNHGLLEIKKTSWRRIVQINYTGR